MFMKYKDISHKRELDVRCAKVRSEIGARFLSPKYLLSYVIAQYVWQKTLNEWENVTSIGHINIIL